MTMLDEPPVATSTVRPSRSVPVAAQPSSWRLALRLARRETRRRPGRTLLLQSHIDTVPASPEWTRDPWSGERKDGRLCGLGSNDTKGGGAAMLCAVRELAAAG